MITKGKSRGERVRQQFITNEDSPEVFALCQTFIYAIVYNNGY